MPSLEEQRYVVSQLIAEGRERGFPTLMTLIAVGLFFEKHGITPPVSLIEWLGEGVVSARVYH